MATLNWIGKEAVANHDKEVPFKLLKKIKSVSVGEHSQNLIVHGDNLEALKALMPYYVGKVKCIYIDPPYNTGNEGWVYNDKVNSPKIKQWLGKVVGRESEDLTRHDKWLCMMYPRLKLLRDLLAEDGLIFISIDDNEHCDLRMLMDEVFEEKNFIANVIWQKRISPEARLQLGAAHDYVVVYAKNIDLGKKRIRNIPLSERRTSEYKNLDNDPRGPWASRDLTGQMGHATKNQFYELTTPSGKKYSPPAGRCWTMTIESYEDLVKDNRVWFGNDSSSRPRLKLFLSESKGTTTWTWWPNSEVGHNQEATKELNDLFETGGTFENPKPTRLIKRILQISLGNDELVLDSFAGSGTTAHAVLDLNKEDGGSRKFILVQMTEGKKNIAKDITAERVKRAIKKYDYKDGFEYCELDRPLFDQDGQIEESCDFKRFATYIYFTETQTNINAKEISGNYIGEAGETEYYLLYKGKLKNDLDKSALKIIKDTGKKKVIYADRCLLDADELALYNITFKQIPYEVKVY